MARKKAPRRRGCPTPAQAEAAPSADETLPVVDNEPSNSSSSPRVVQEQQAPAAETTETDKESPSKAEKETRPAKDTVPKEEEKETRPAEDTAVPNKENRPERASKSREPAKPPAPSKPEGEVCKDLGNEAFRTGNYEAAIAAYTSGLEKVRSGALQSTLLSNRAAASLSLARKTAKGQANWDKLLELICSAFEDACEALRGECEGELRAKTVVRKGEATIAWRRTVLRCEDVFVFDKRGQYDPLDESEQSPGVGEAGVEGVGAVSIPLTRDALFQVALSGLLSPGMLLRVALMLASLAPPRHPDHAYFEAAKVIKAKTKVVIAETTTKTLWRQILRCFVELVDLAAHDFEFPQGERPRLVIEDLLDAYLGSDPFPPNKVAFFRRAMGAAHDIEDAAVASRVFTILHNRGDNLVKLYAEPHSKARTSSRWAKEAYEVAVLALVDVARPSLEEKTQVKGEQVITFASDALDAALFAGTFDAAWGDVFAGFQLTLASSLRCRGDAIPEAFDVSDQTILGDSKSDAITWITSRGEAPSTMLRMLGRRFAHADVGTDACLADFARLTLIRIAGPLVQGGRACCWKHSAKHGADAFMYTCQELEGDFPYEHNEFIEAYFGSNDENHEETDRFDDENDRESESTDDREDPAPAIDECVMCMDNVKNVLMLPCRHLALCSACETVVANANKGPRECPVCREPVTSTLKIFL